MTRPPARIDLGELPSPGSGQASDPPDSAGGGMRPWLAAAVAAALLLTMHASTDAPPPWAVHEFTAAGQLAAVSRDTLYTVHHGAFNRQTLAAYPLADGYPAWEVTREVGREVYTDDQGRAVMRHAWFAIEDGLPLHVATVQVGDPQDRHDALGRVWRPDAATTTVFDPRTGRVLWTRDGLPIGTTSGDLLLFEDWADGSVERGKTAVYGATGETVWSIRKPAGQHDHNQHLLANHSEDGHLTTYDLAGGGQLATVQTSLRPTEGALVRDDLVLLWQRERRPSVVAYDADGLARRWSVDLPVEGVAGGCRTVVCLHGPGGVVVLDPETGAKLWSFDWPRPGRHTAQEVGGQGRRAWLLLHLRTEPDYALRTWIVEGRTGELVLDVTGWELPVGDQPDQMIQRRTAHETWFGRLTADPPRVQVLGSLGYTTTCVTAEPHLACQTGGQVEVWLLRR